MKSSCQIIFSLKIITLILYCFSSNLLATEYFLIPGHIQSGPRGGLEITLAMNGRYKYNEAAYEGNGIVLGGWRDSKDETSLEIQHQVHGYFVLGYAAGLGAYRSKYSHGIQATISIQYWTPFLMFARQQIQIFPSVNATKPQYGLMFKLPIPIATTSDK